MYYRSPRETVTGIKRERDGRAAIRIFCNGSRCKIQVTGLRCLPVLTLASIDWVADPIEFGCGKFYMAAVHIFIIKQLDGLRLAAFICKCDSKKFILYIYNL